jgi:GDP-D-mannose 3', 5'-epimerase
MNSRVLITGAGGFIGGHLVGKLLKEGHRVRAVDKKPQSQWYQRFAAAENLNMNLQEKGACIRAVNGCDWIYNMAADMGGMGFIELNKGLCMLTVLINTHMLMAARQSGATRFFFSLLRVYLRRLQAAANRQPCLKGGGRLSGRPGGRLWVGETFQRKNVSAFSGRLWSRNPRRSIS